MQTATFFALQTRCRSPPYIIRFARSKIKNNRMEYEKMHITINLREYYPWYVTDEFVEVTEEVAEELMADKRYEKTHERSTRRNKVLSLDAEDGTEEAASMVCHSDCPETVVAMIEVHCRLCRALNSLPKNQGRRIDAHYLHGMSQTEIAIKEGVGVNSVNESIKRGLRSMAKSFSTNFENSPNKCP